MHAILNGDPALRLFSNLRIINILYGLKRRSHGRQPGAKMSRMLKLLKRLRRGKSSIRKRNRVRKRVDVSIGIFSGTTPFDLRGEAHDNPVLSADDVSDVRAQIVADPFMLKVHDRWHMFFEVFNMDREKGEIGLATSSDGFHWVYQGIVLREPHHLSYPYVFEWQGKCYMVPESREVNTVPIYEGFPDEWKQIGCLIDGSPCADSTIFRHQDSWWMFAETSAGSHDRLSLYRADDLLGPWIEHPQSPLVEGDARKARLAGRVSAFEGSLIRFAQDCSVVYGQQVRAFEIVELGADRYEEKEVKESPVLTPGELGWNGRGMHHVDPHQIGTNQWIACVDGFSETIVRGS